MRKIGYLLNSIVKIIIRSEHAYLFGKIYAPNIDAEREGFFASVTDILLNVSCPVCLGGDFSAVRSLKEKIGSFMNLEAMKSFSCFINSLHLVDLPLSGGKFTWCNNHEIPAFSRLFLDVL